MPYRIVIYGVTRCNILIMCYLMQCVCKLYLCCYQMEYDGVTRYNV